MSFFETDVDRCEAEAEKKQYRCKPLFEENQIKIFSCHGAWFFLQRCREAVVKFQKRISLNPFNKCLADLLLNRSECHKC